MELFTTGLILLALISDAWAIFCYKCESYRDFRCLDPFDYQPHIQINCDFEHFVRDRKPVFCEKTTELIDGVYVTTRGCSTRQWEDVDLYVDHRNQDLRCFRRGSVEHCLCSTDSCNGANHSVVCTHLTILVLSVLVPLLVAWKH
ncbi:hypothetical protein TCAL_08480 [Tigriopus californicus]|uniref:Uncharacterized protein n=1 Tax=Tigriopus californicus TaxID=6832 RepID=A0A553NR50_TIGCA|nr:protein quiver-like [Tigriopus californicus]TRY67913.1 hypothetical protein TCAL_08480 [Tigriopus californicus]